MRCLVVWQSDRPLLLFYEWELRHCTEDWGLAQNRFMNQELLLGRTGNDGKDVRRVGPTDVSNLVFNQSGTTHAPL